MISNDARLLLLQTAFQEISDLKIEILDLELRRPPPSYTVDTLEEIRKTYPGEMALVVGNEVFAQFPRWKNPRRILELAHCVVIKRTNENVKNPRQVLHEIGIVDVKEISPEKITHHAEFRWIDFREIKARPFSSTAIRKQIGECWKKNDLSVAPPGIQESVWLLIKEKQLYCR